MKKLLLLIIILNITGYLFSQVEPDSIFFSGDTVIFHRYFPNGNLWIEERVIKGRDYYYSYRFQETYDINGTLTFYEYFDINIPQWDLYLKSIRKNGTVKYISEPASYGNKKTYNNRKGELKRIRKTYYGEQYKIIEKYKNGVLQKTKKRYYKVKPLKAKYKTIKHHEGQIGDNLEVIIISKENGDEYHVNGKLLTEDEYLNYEKEYNTYLKSRRRKHKYQEYTSDSILIYEGIFKKIDLPCGYYWDYHLNGNIRIRGNYNKNGKEDGEWHYYNEEGQNINRETYKNGKLIK